MSGNVPIIVPGQIVSPSLTKNQLSRLRCCVLRVSAMQDRVVSCPVQGVYEAVHQPQYQGHKSLSPSVTLLAGCNNSHSLHVHSTGANNSE